ncbi:hypothetical protein [Hymenobacter metallilatus]|nr:hypothetical protein [Hymenobacter metallilatus]
MCDVMQQEVRIFPGKGAGWGLVGWLILLSSMLAGCEQAPQQLSAAQVARQKSTLIHRDSLRADSVARAGGQLPGAVLPDSRIVAFYGNPQYKTMGILGQYPKDEMLRRLRVQTARWQQADSLPVRPALHLITVIAQRDSGADGKYRLPLPDSTIRRVIRWGQEHQTLVFLDVQVGLSDLQHELPPLAKYLRLPFVHLGIDPEFSMKSGRRPGTEVGEFDATDINYARSFLARLVSENQLPPKVLVVHRFRQDMVTNYQNIRLDPRVQIVMHMDGWGTPSIKRSSYRKYIKKEPVEYAGFKLFLRHDQRPGSRLMTPQEVVNLSPSPLYVQYQ